MVRSALPGNFNQTATKEQDTDTYAKICENPGKTLASGRESSEVIELSPEQGGLFDNLDDELLSVEDVARLFRRKTKTIKNWIAKREFPFIRVGRKTFVRKESLLAWLKRKEFRPWE